MNLRLILRTVVHLKVRQIVNQVINRVWCPKYSERRDATLRNSLSFTSVDTHIKTVVEWCEKPKAWLGGTTFTFLNLEAEPKGWTDAERGMLWAYNLNYMDWLNQPSIEADTAAEWIDSFIEAIPRNRVGLDPYPIALRSINWIKIFVRYPQLATQARVDSLYSQVKHLERKLEYHLLGNHLLEDAYSLFIAGNIFADDKLLNTATHLLEAELQEQILRDGAHYEQSPMYHCILLDRLLDCINFDTTNNKYLRSVASAMLGHLEAIKWNDSEVPLFNDSAYSIAPTPDELFAYAQRLHIDWVLNPLGDCGYRRMESGRMEVIADVGNVKATYQPGHTHADALSYEMRVDGKPIIVDTGITTYNKNARRQYERSTAAHNTVSIDGKDSLEVWGGFRVGGRSKVQILEDTPQTLSARLSTGHQRTFRIDETGLTIIDTIPANRVGKSYIHLAPGIILREEDLSIQGAYSVEMKTAEVATEYNRPMSTQCIVITFRGSLTTHISRLS